jgi:hypothetical protein
MHILGSPDRIRSLHVFSTRLLAAAMLVTFAMPADSQGGKAPWNTRLFIALYR